VIPTDAVVAKVDALPTLPAAVSRLAALHGSETTSASDFEDAIKPDPALTANLLKMANSAYFGLRREVDSVGQAVTVLGTKRVWEAAVTAGFSKTIPDRIPGYEVDSAVFWKHCIAVAILSERLSSQMELRTPKLTFTAGLLHDIGKLAIGSFLTVEATLVLSRMRTDEMDFVAAEREVLGTDHAEVGATVADKWGLPEAIGVGARWHHCPDEVPNEEDQVLVDLVHVADALAHTLGYGADVGELARTLDQRAADRLELTVDCLELVACNTLEEIQQVSEVFAPSGGAGK